MATEWTQRQITRLLDEAEAAISQLDWEAALQRAQAILAFDPESEDGTALLDAAQRALADLIPPDCSSPLVAFSKSPHILNRWVEPLSLRRRHCLATRSPE